MFGRQLPRLSTSGLSCKGNGVGDCIEWKDSMSQFLGQQQGGAMQIDSIACHYGAPNVMDQAGVGSSASDICRRLADRLKREKADMAASDAEYPSSATKPRPPGCEFGYPPTNGVVIQRVEFELPTPQNGGRCLKKDSQTKKVLCDYKKDLNNAELLQNIRTWYSSSGGKLASMGYRDMIVSADTPPCNLFHFFDTSTRNIVERARSDQRFEAYKKEILALNENDHAAVIGNGDRAGYYLGVVNAYLNPTTSKAEPKPLKIEDPGQVTEQKIIEAQKKIGLGKITVTGQNGEKQDLETMHEKNLEQHPEPAPEPATWPRDDDQSGRSDKVCSYLTKGKIHRVPRDWIETAQKDANGNRVKVQHHAAGMCVKFNNRDLTLTPYKQWKIKDFACVYVKGTESAASTTGGCQHIQNTEDQDAALENAFTNVPRYVEGGGYQKHADCEFGKPDTGGTSFSYYLTRKGPCIKRNNKGEPVCYFGFTTPMHCRKIAKDESKAQAKRVGMGVLDDNASPDFFLTKWDGKRNAYVRLGRPGAIATPVGETMNTISLSEARFVEGPQPGTRTAHGFSWLYDPVAHPFSTTLGEVGPEKSNAQAVLLTQSTYRPEDIYFVYDSNKWPEAEFPYTSKLDREDVAYIQESGGAPVQLLGSTTTMKRAYTLELLKYQQDACRKLQGHAAGWELAEEAPSGKANRVDGHFQHDKFDENNRLPRQVGHAGANSCERICSSCDWFEGFGKKDLGPAKEKLDLGAFVFWNRKSIANAERRKDKDAPTSIRSLLGGGPSKLLETFGPPNAYAYKLYHTPGLVKNSQSSLLRVTGMPLTSYEQAQRENVFFGRNNWFGDGNEDPASDEFQGRCAVGAEGTTTTDRTTTTDVYIPLVDLQESKLACEFCERRDPGRFAAAKEDADLAELCAACAGVVIMQQLRETFKTGRATSKLAAGVVTGYPSDQQDEPSCELNVSEHEGIREVNYIQKTVLQKQYMKQCKNQVDDLEELNIEQIRLDAEQEIRKYHDKYPEPKVAFPMDSDCIKQPYAASFDKYTIELYSSDATCRSELFPDRGLDATFTGLVGIRHFQLKQDPINRNYPEFGAATELTEGQGRKLLTDGTFYDVEGERPGLYHVFWAWVPNQPPSYSHRKWLGSLPENCQEDVSRICRGAEPTIRKATDCPQACEKRLQQLQLGQNGEGAPAYLEVGADFTADVNPGECSALGIYRQILNFNRRQHPGGRSLCFMDVQLQDRSKREGWGMFSVMRPNLVGHIEQQEPKKTILLSEDCAKKLDGICAGQERKEQRKKLHDTKELLVYLAGELKVLRDKLGKAHEVFSQAKELYSKARNAVSTFQTQNHQGLAHALQNKIISNWVLPEKEDPETTWDTQHADLERAFTEYERKLTKADADAQRGTADVPELPNFEQRVDWFVQSADVLVKKMQDVSSFAEALQKLSGVQKQVAELQQSADNSRWRNVGQVDSVLPYVVCIDDAARALEPATGVQALMSFASRMGVPVRQQEQAVVAKLKSFFSLSTAQQDSSGAGAQRKDGGLGERANWVRNRIADGATSAADLAGDVAALENALKSAKSDAGRIESAWTDFAAELQGRLEALERESGGPQSAEHKHAARAFLECHSHETGTGAAGLLRLVAIAEKNDRLASLIRQAPGFMMHILKQVTASAEEALEARLSELSKRCDELSEESWGRRGLADVSDEIPPVSIKGPGGETKILEKPYYAPQADAGALRSAMATGTSANAIENSLKGSRDQHGVWQDELNKVENVDGLLADQDLSHDFKEKWRGGLQAKCIAAQLYTTRLLRVWEAVLDKIGDQIQAASKAEQDQRLKEAEEAEARSRVADLRRRVEGLLDGARKLVSRISDDRGAAEEARKDRYGGFLVRAKQLEDTASNLDQQARQLDRPGDGRFEDVNSKCNTAASELEVLEKEYDRERTEMQSEAERLAEWRRKKGELQGEGGPCFQVEAFAGDEATWATLEELVGEVDDLLAEQRGPGAGAVVKNPAAGNPGEAREAFRRLSESANAARGPLHWDTISGSEDIGAAEKACNKFDESGKALATALAARLVELGGSDSTAVPSAHPVSRLAENFMARYEQKGQDGISAELVDALTRVGRRWKPKEGHRADWLVSELLRCAAAIRNARDGWAREKERVERVCGAIANACAAEEGGGAAAGGPLRWPREHEYAELVDLVRDGFSSFSAPQQAGSRLSFGAWFAPLVAAALPPQRQEPLVGLLEGVQSAWDTSCLVGQVGSTRYAKLEDAWGRYLSELTSRLDVLGKAKEDAVRSWVGDFAGPLADVELQFAKEPAGLFLAHVDADASDSRASPCLGRGVSASARGLVSASIENMASQADEAAARAVSSLRVARAAAFGDAAGAEVDREADRLREQRGAQDTLQGDGLRIEEDTGRRFVAAVDGFHNALLEASIELPAPLTLGSAGDLWDAAKLLRDLAKGGSAEEIRTAQGDYRAKRESFVTSLGHWLSALAQWPGAGADRGSTEFLEASGYGAVPVFSRDLEGPATAAVGKVYDWAAGDLRRRAEKVEADMAQAVRNYRRGAHGQVDAALKELEESLALFSQKRPDVVHPGSWKPANFRAAFTGMPGHSEEVLELERKLEKLKGLLHAFRERAKRVSDVMEGYGQQNTDGATSQVWDAFLDSIEPPLKPYLDQLQIAISAVQDECNKLPLPEAPAASESLSSGRQDGNEDALVQELITLVGSHLKARNENPLFVPVQQYYDCLDEVQSFVSAAGPFGDDAEFGQSMTTPLRRFREVKDQFEERAKKAQRPQLDRLFVEDFREQVISRQQEDHLALSNIIQQKQREQKTALDELRQQLLMMEEGAHSGQAQELDDLRARLEGIGLPAAWKEAARCLGDSLAEDFDGELAATSDRIASARNAAATQGVLDQVEGHLSRAEASLRASAETLTELEAFHDGIMAASSSAPGDEVSSAERLGFLRGAAAETVGRIKQQKTQLAALEHSNEAASLSLRRCDELLGAQGEERDAQVGAEADRRGLRNKILLAKGLLDAEISGAENARGKINNYPLEDVLEKALISALQRAEDAGRALSDEEGGGLPEAFQQASVNPRNGDGFDTLKRLAGEALVEIQAGAAGYEEAGEALSVLSGLRDDNPAPPAAGAPAGTGQEQKRYGAGLRLLRSRAIFARKLAETESQVKDALASLRVDLARHMGKETDGHLLSQDANDLAALATGLREVFALPIGDCLRELDRFSKIAPRVEDPAAQGQQLHSAKLQERVAALAEEVDKLRSELMEFVRKAGERKIATLAEAENALRDVMEQAGEQFRAAEGALQGAAAAIAAADFQEPDTVWEAAVDAALSAGKALRAAGFGALLDSRKGLVVGLAQGPTENPALPSLIGEAGKLAAAIAGHFGRLDEMQQSVREKRAELAKGRQSRLGEACGDVASAEGDERVAFHTEVASAAQLEAYLEAATKLRRALAQCREAARDLAHRINFEPAGGVVLDSEGKLRKLAEREGTKRAELQTYLEAAKGARRRAAEEQERRGRAQKETRLGKLRDFALGLGGALAAANSAIRSAGALKGLTAPPGDAARAFRDDARHAAGKLAAVQRASRLEPSNPLLQQVQSARIRAQAAAGDAVLRFASSIEAALAGCADISRVGHDGFGDRTALRSSSGEGQPWQDMALQRAGDIQRAMDGARMSAGLGTALDVVCETYKLQPPLQQQNTVSDVEAALRSEAGREKCEKAASLGREIARCRSGLEAVAVSLQSEALNMATGGAHADVGTCAEAAIEARSLGEGRMLATARAVSAAAARIQARAAFLEQFDPLAASTMWGTGDGRQARTGFAAAAAENETARRDCEAAAAAIDRGAQRLAQATRQGCEGDGVAVAREDALRSGLEVVRGAQEALRALPRGGGQSPAGQALTEAASACQNALAERETRARRACDSAGAALSGLAAVLGPAGVPDGGHGLGLRQLAAPAQMALRGEETVRAMQRRLDLALRSLSPEAAGAGSGQNWHSVEEACVQLLRDVNDAAAGLREQQEADAQREAEGETARKELQGYTDRCVEIRSVVEKSLAEVPSARLESQLQEKVGEGETSVAQLKGILDKLQGLQIASPQQQHLLEEAFRHCGAAMKSATLLRDQAQQSIQHRQAEATVTVYFRDKGAAICGGPGLGQASLGLPLNFSPNPNSLAHKIILKNEIYNELPPETAERILGIDVHFGPAPEGGKKVWLISFRCGRTISSRGDDEVLGA
ncbi:unnamed protein product [Amoebophrya sp. A120]|nr:unnamed protein product [Amoebophrya sp. A120]|eukprot:GSA120T00019220001.1